MKSNVFRYIDYIPNLPEDEKKWYRLFIQAYYMQSTKAMDAINMPREMRRAIYRNNRAVKADPFNKNLVDYWRDEDDVCKK